MTVVTPGVARIHATLPIFRLDAAHGSVLYAPGRATAVSEPLAREVTLALSGTGTSIGGEAERLARVLEEQGALAARAWRELAEKPFAPECLTLYLSNRCNLGCTYCYAAPADEGRARLRLRMHSTVERHELPILQEPIVDAAARLVARNCVSKRKPLTLVLHGGGEPTVHWDLLQRVREIIDRIAAGARLAVWSYIATHGVLREKQARWLASRFDRIGLSCDGPPDIQNANRPTAGGAATAAIVEQTARVFAQSGTPFTVRATITRTQVRRQSEILSYVCDRLQARSIRFEPVYEGRHRSPNGFRPEHADEFVEHFLLARDLARQKGCDLQVSGVRIDEIHGPYCNPLREVLQITPDGVATACFLSTGGGEADDAVMALGRLDPATGEFMVNQARATALRRRAARVPAKCEACVNVYHCARDCPDVCVITADLADQQHEGFRCRVQKALGQHQIWEMAVFN